MHVGSRHDAQAAKSFYDEASSKKMENRFRGHLRMVTEQLEFRKVCDTRTRDLRHPHLHVTPGGAICVTHAEQFT